MPQRNRLSPLITVVMATLNAAKDLPRSLGSLAEQQWRDFEVVLVDGGSTDQTCQQAAKLLEQATIPHRVVVVPGSGIYAAINHGVRLAAGEWVYVMGADDRLMEAGVFASLAPHLRAATPRTLVVHGDVWIEQPGYRYGQPWDLARFLDRNLSHQSAFYRRRTIAKLAISYDERYSLYADWDYNLKLSARGRFQYVPLLIASYACSGASSQRQDPVFLAEKERNAWRYFGWRSIYLMPPHHLATLRADHLGLLFHLQFLLNRLIWALKRSKTGSHPPS